MWMVRGLRAIPPITASAMVSLPSFACHADGANCERGMGDPVWALGLMGSAGLWALVGLGLSGSWLEPISAILGTPSHLPTIRNASMVLKRCLDSWPYNAPARIPAQRNYGRNPAYCVDNLEKCCMRALLPLAAPMSASLSGAANGKCI